MDRITGTASPHRSIHVDLSLISVDVPLERDLQCQFLGELRQQEADILTETLVLGRDQLEGHYTQGRGVEAEIVDVEGGESTAANDIAEINRHTSSSSSSSSSNNKSSNNNSSSSNSNSSSSRRTEDIHYSTSNRSHTMKPSQPTSSHSPVYPHLHTLPTLRGVYLYATDCRVVQELDVVLWKQTTLARRAFLAAVHS